MTVHGVSREGDGESVMGRICETGLKLGVKDGIVEAESLESPQQIM